MVKSMLVNKIMNKFPTISILTLSYNPPVELLEEFFQTIKKQSYPKNKIEHIFIDGGSDNDVLKIAKKYKAKIYTNKKWKNDIALRQYLATIKAKNEILIWLPTDNILHDKQTFEKLIIPFNENNDVIATYSFHYDYNKTRPLLDRYCALMGVSDPVAYYMEKSDRRPWFERRDKKYNIVRKTKTYSVITFDEVNLPTVGDNGFLVKRDVFVKGKISKEYFFHTDIFVDLIKKGYKTFAVVYDVSVEHVIKSSFKSLIDRRTEYMERDARENKIMKRRYLIFDSKKKSDKLKLLKFILFTITLVQPFYISVRGYLKIRDIAWFVHPFICYLFLIYYGKSIFKKSAQYLLK